MRRVGSVGGWRQGGCRVEWAEVERGERMKGLNGVEERGRGRRRRRLLWVRGARGTLGRSMSLVRSLAHSFTRRRRRATIGRKMRRGHDDRLWMRIRMRTRTGQRERERGEEGRWNRRTMMRINP